jgi:predicted O-methyltransferase YrrM
VGRFDWISDGRAGLDGVTFLLDGYDDVFSSEDGLHLQKTRPLVEAIAGIVEDLQPKRIFELGICRGGSVAMLLLLAQPTRHVAIELEPAEPNFEQWLAENAPAGVVSTYYGVDQADSRALREIVDRDFGGVPLDLVIDDASHRLEETRASFNALFPYVREGGLYVVEDWSWVHLLEWAILASPAAADGAAAEPGPKAPGQAELGAVSPARLIVEQLLSCAGPLGAVDQVVIDRYLAVVKRGSARLDPATFDIADCYGPTGRSLVTGNQPRAR